MNEKQQKLKEKFISHNSTLLEFLVTPGGQALVKFLKAAFDDDNIFVTDSNGRSDSFRTAYNLGARDVVRTLENLMEMTRG